MLFGSCASASVVSHTAWAYWSGVPSFMRAAAQLFEKRPSVGKMIDAVVNETMAFSCSPAAK